VRLRSTKLGRRHGIYAHYEPNPKSGDADLPSGLEANGKFVQGYSCDDGGPTRSL
jgi:hypothetical protein